MKLSEQVSILAKRVDSLETSNIDTLVGVARLTKTFGNIKISINIVTSVHQFKICSSTLII